MLKIKSIAAILLLVIFTEYANVSCQTPLSDLPPDPLADVLSIIINDTVNVIGNCSNNGGVQLTYRLYTREAPNDATPLTSFNQINPQNPIKILLHGWGGNPDVIYMQVIKNAYLTNSSYNVIIVDWSAYAGGSYFSAYCNVPLVGQALARYISDMSSQLNVSLTAMHVVGHSLGAQVAGLLGYAMIQANGTLGRITGLDPAGPLYQGIDRNQRLSENDADFVDIIHTNQFQFGYAGKCGDVDFYPNCGLDQPGCNFNISLLNPQQILNSPLDWVRCNHERSCYLFAESIVYNDFPSRPVDDLQLTLCPVLLPITNGFQTGAANMGEYCRSNPTDYNSFVLRTNGSSPFGTRSA